MKRLQHLTPEQRKEHYKRAGEKRAATIRAKHGEDYYSRIGKLGGKSGTGNQFAHGKISAAEAGSIKKK